MNVDGQLSQAYLHPWQSFLFQHVTPPLGFLTNAIVYDLGQPVSFYVMMILSLGGTIIAAASTYLTCKALDVRTAISFVLTLGYSISMMRIQQSLNWFLNDTLIYVFLPLFIWKVIIFLKEPGRRHGLHLGLLSGLMIWRSLCLRALYLC